MILILFYVVIGHLFLLYIFATMYTTVITNIAHQISIVQVFII